MTKVVIIGGGPAGLVTNWVFLHIKGITTTLLEPGALGGEFLAGGLKYLHKTDAVIRMLNEIKVSYSSFTVQGGIHLKGHVVPFPSCFRTMPSDVGLRVRADHYRKTRRTQPDSWAASSMNNVVNMTEEKGVRCCFAELVDALAPGRSLIKGRAIGIKPGKIQLVNNPEISWDYLIVTIPIWVLKPMVWFYVPQGVAVALNIIHLASYGDDYGRWDYVYTPYTPADCIHRLSPSGDSYAVECNGELDMVRVQSDLQFLFPNGYAVEKVTTGLKGHLLPLPSQPEWPDNVAPIGRFAQWDPRCTVDVALKNAIKLAERWFGDVIL